MLLPDDELAKLLLQANAIDQKCLDASLLFSKNSRMSLEDTLIDTGVITDDKLGVLEASYFKLPFVDLSKITISEEVFKIIPERIARKFQIIAFAREADTIKLATTNIKNKEIIDLIAKKTGSKILIYFTTEMGINNTLRVYRKNLQERFDQLLKQEVDASVMTGEDMPIAKIVDLLIT